MLTLILLKTDDKPQRFKLDGAKPEIIGRHAPRVKLGDSRVSRKHAEVLLRDGNWLIRDLGSSNGTQVNGERISGTVELAEGDEIRIGRQRMIVAHIDPPIEATVLDLDADELDREHEASSGYHGSEEGDREAAAASALRSPAEDDDALPDAESLGGEGGADDSYMDLSPVAAEPTPPVVGAEAEQPLAEQADVVAGFPRPRVAERS